MTDRIAEPWGRRTPFEQGGDWPTRVDEFLTVPEEAVERWVQSACVLCSNCCGKDVAVKDGRIVGVRGRAVDRVNRGRLGPKGLFGWQANNAHDRLTQPLLRRNGTLEPTDWQTAMGAVVEQSKRVLDTRGPLAMGFYNTGQLFLEEYYALAMIAWGGLGTNNIDGNTRLCTATAEWALKLSFGCDGQPSSYRDVDFADALFLVGHNVAETQTVLWMRMLDRLEGPDPPKLVVVDPRPSPAARRADLWLQVRNGTNLALLNAIQHELIRNGQIDEHFIDRHLVDFEVLTALTDRWPPERAADICGVEPDAIRAAAQVLGRSERLLATCLQGVYQSWQASAAAVQVNNIVLLRGMIGKPGCGVLQMNGQPTSQNARECGASGVPPGFRNWQNEAHMTDLARLWNVDRIQLPTWSEPTHVMKQIRLMEQGNISFWWVICTNPAVSLPELRRIRDVLSQERLFLVVQDAFLTETAQMADVVLPAAMWGEKTGTYTNADRTVHLSEKAIEPPGQARADLDILLDYARRMGVKDKDGRPLPPFDDPESAFEAWKECSKGRLCDYSGITYDKLRGASGIQWPCNAEHPEGTERLYEDLHFWSSAATANDYGKDLLTGAVVEPATYRSQDPAGRAILRAADYVPPPEQPSDDFPFTLGTGRTLYHWHTRTKTGRAPQLTQAARDVWVEISAPDAERMSIEEGDTVAVETPRGRVEARARLTDIKQGCIFVPFHYGYWDAPDSDRGGPGQSVPTAANELTISMWDPASRQPLFKTAAARLSRLSGGNGQPSSAPTTTASRPAQEVSGTAGDRHAEVTETSETHVGPAGNGSRGEPGGKVAGQA